MDGVMIKEEASACNVVEHEEKSAATTKKIKISDVRSLFFFNDKPDEYFEITELETPLEEASTSVKNKTKTSSKSNKSKMNDQTKFPCFECSFYTYDGEQYLNHISSRHPKDQSKLCNKSAPKKLIHSKIEPVLTNFRCPNCRLLIDAKLKKSHRETCIEFKCDSCPFKCWKKEAAEEHKLVHLPKCICSSLNCNFQTLDRQAFDDHLLVHKIKKEMDQNNISQQNQTICTRSHKKLIKIQQDP